MASASVSNNSREYCLRWNNHQPNMATYFGNLYNSESLVDVTLVSAEGNKILAHKLVLSACSAYFQHIFESNPCKHPVVILKDVQHSDLEAIVKFIYNGEVNISQDRMTPILKTANSLQVKGLAEVPADELKRVSSVVGNNSDRDSSSLRPHKNSSVATSLSWDNSDSANDIPRKKLKKSASTSASYMSAGSVNTNGDHSASIDSGVGASVSKSMDESGPGDETPPSVVQKRVSFPGPPPLLPKARSLDLHRDMHDDHDMNASLSEHHQRQSYDDSSVGFDRGYDVEVAEEMDGGGEYDEEGEMGYYEENEEYYDDESFDDGTYEDHVSAIQSNGKSQMPHLKPSQSSSNISANQVRELLQSSNPTIGDGERRRRGRPLLRQPRIKRSDNEPSTGLRDPIGSQLSSRDSLGPTGGGGGDDSNDSSGCGGGEPVSFVERGRRSVTPTREVSPQPSTTSIHSSKSNLPIVRVSQCSPTPPSSPQHHLPSTTASHSLATNEEESDQKPVIVSTMSITSSSLNSSIGGNLGGSGLSSCSTMVITPNTNNITLLKVPRTESLTLPNTSSLSSSGGNHLVKQISQPSLPSEILVPISTGNPVIRRQNSSPATAGQPQISRIVQPMSKSGTQIFQIIQQTPERSSLEDSGTSKTFFIDLLPPTVVTDKDPPRRELKKDSSGEQSGSFSREDSTSAEDIGSSTSSSSFDDGLPVNRSGHCPALRPGPALGCNYCWNSVDDCGRILRRKTKYHCPECHINLCIVPCFQNYHEEAADKKKKPRSKLGLPKPSSM